MWTFVDCIGVCNQQMICICSKNVVHNALLVVQIALVMVHKRPGDGPQKPWRIGDLWDTHPGGTGTS